jgi:hypothetical protein
VAQRSDTARRSCLSNPLDLRGEIGNGLQVDQPTSHDSTCINSGGWPLALHPKNPHYFLFRGKPAILVTSGEHYGAVLNLDFDYRKYLATLAENGLNLTRTFSGAYVEPVGAFKIERNTLAPSASRLICPWARSNTPGYVNGGTRFDLTRWDDAYSRRLKDFVAKADERGIVVELNLFTPMYEDPRLSTCVELKGEGPSTIILETYNRAQ